MYVESATRCTDTARVDAKSVVMRSVRPPAGLARGAGTDGPRSTTDVSPPGGPWCRMLASRRSALRVPFPELVRLTVLPSAGDLEDLAGHVVRAAQESSVVQPADLVGDGGICGGVDGRRARDVVVVVVPAHDRSVVD